MVPFAYESRREMGEYNEWTCECGNSFYDGWMVEAAHYPDKHRRGVDRDIDNGRILCRKCHLMEHIDLFLEREDEWSYNSLKLLANTCYVKGLHTYEHYRSNPLDIIDDRDDIVSTFIDKGLNPSTFLSED